LLQVIRGNPRARNEIAGISGVVTISVKTDSYLHIGTGRPAVQLTTPIPKTITNFDQQAKQLAEHISLDYAEFVCTKYPVIPGSTVKGNVRARLELSFKPKEGKIRSCFIKADRSKKVAKGRHGWRHQEIWKRATQEDRGEPCSYTDDEGRKRGVCLLCDLFGTEGLLGLVSFDDLYGKNVNLQHKSLKYGVKIIVAPPNSVFTGTVAFRNLTQSELGLLLWGMRIRNSRIGEPALLGKYKYQYKDMGKVRYVVEDIWLSYESQPIQEIRPGSSVGKEQLDKFIEHLLSETIRDFGEELEDVDEVGRCLSMS